MHEPSPSDTSTSAAPAEAASSPILTIVSAMPLKAQAGEQLLDATLVGDEQERHRAVLALDDHVGVEQQRDVAVAGTRRRARTRRSRASMSVAIDGGVGSISMPVIIASALM